jgi:hypothetical protein
VEGSLGEEEEEAGEQAGVLDALGARHKGIDVGEAGGVMWSEGERV